MSQTNVNVNPIDIKEATNDKASAVRVFTFKNHPRLEVGENWLENWSIDDTARRVEFQLSLWDSGIRQRVYVEKCLSFGQQFKALRKARCLDRKDIAEITSVSPELLLSLEKGLLLSHEIEALFARIASALMTTPELLYGAFQKMGLDDEIPLPDNFQPLLQSGDPYDVLNDNPASAEQFASDS